MRPAATACSGDMERLHRFLFCSDGSTYYTSAKDLTKDNAAVVFRVASTKPLDLVREIVEVKRPAGRSPRPNTAIFALAIAASPPTPAEGQRAALAALPQVCRTGSQLFLFLKYVEQFRGWGPALTKAVARWYTGKPVGKLAYQLAKYRQREGESQLDALRRSHPSTGEYARRLALNWAVGKGLNDYPSRAAAEQPFNPKDRSTWLEARPKLSRAQELPDEVAIIADFEDAQAATTTAEWTKIIGRGHGLSWEMLPDAAVTQAPVWEALLAEGVPQTALIRQLPRLTNLGLCTGERGQAGSLGQLNDVQKLKLGRVHPINILVAQRTYASGAGARGHLTWMPVPEDQRCAERRLLHLLRRCGTV